MSQQRVKATKIKAARTSRQTTSTFALSQRQMLVDEESHTFRLGDTTSQQGSTIFTVFHNKESKLDVEKRVQISRQPFVYQPTKRIANPYLYRDIISLPLRPAWNNRLSREEVQKTELTKFEEYLDIIYKAVPPSRLTHFEHNLDVWRQLWRVCELSDILCVTVDSRYPLFHLPPALYNFIVNKMNKPLFVILNKIDLVPSSHLTAWKRYLEQIYPGVHVVFFTSHPNPDTITASDDKDSINTLQKGMSLTGANGTKQIGAGSAGKYLPVGSSLLKTCWNVIAYMIEDQKRLQYDYDDNVHLLHDEGEEEEVNHSNHNMLTNGMIKYALAYSKQRGIADVINASAQNDDSNDESNAAQTSIPTTLIVTDAQERLKEQHYSKRAARRVVASNTLETLINKNIQSPEEDDTAKDVLVEQADESVDVTNTEEAEDDEEEDVKATFNPFAALASISDEEDDHEDADENNATVTPTKVEQNDVTQNDITVEEIKPKVKQTVSPPPQKSVTIQEVNKDIVQDNGVDTDASTDFDSDDDEVAKISTTLTIGMVGHPNAGKSSFINALLGRAAVSVSNAPGHTKHLQTLCRVPNCPNVRLCDCPGLVFPAVDIPRSLQTVMGIFPYTKLSEPYTCVQFLAERLPLVNIYALKPFLGPDSDAGLNGASLPGGNYTALVENYLELQQEFRGRSVIYPQERHGKYIYSVLSTDDIPYNIYKPGVLTTALPEHLANIGEFSENSPSTEDLPQQSPVSSESTTVPPPPTRAVPPPPKYKGKINGKNNKNNGKNNGKNNNSVAHAPIVSQQRKKDPNLVKFDENHEIDMSSTLDNMLAKTSNDIVTNPRFVWSAYRICESFAVKKGWYNEMSGMPDTHKAGMTIVKDCVDGRLNLWFLPPVGNLASIAAAHGEQELAQTRIDVQTE